MCVCGVCMCVCVWLVCVYYKDKYYITTNKCTYILFNKRFYRRL